MKEIKKELREASLPPADKKQKVEGATDEGKKKFGYITKALQTHLGVGVNTDSSVKKEDVQMTSEPNNGNANQIEELEEGEL